MGIHISCGFICIFQQVGVFYNYSIYPIIQVICFLLQQIQPVFYFGNLRIDRIKQILFEFRI